MALIINLIAAIILFAIPIRAYYGRYNLIVKHPFEKEVNMRISYELYFLVFSVLTAMIFLGPISLVKYGFWILIFIVLAISGHLQIKLGPIVGSYLLFLAWSVLSAIFFSSATFQAQMMLIKYTLPLLYLWLGYSAINDHYDLLYFMKKATIGMVIYALIIGGFSAKFLGPLYNLLNFTSNGLFISYASLADYFSGLIVVPIGLYIITKNKIWIYATGWVALSTILETVRTGLGGILLASSFFLGTILRGKAVPWVAGIIFTGVLIVFTVPSFRDKMFINEDVTMSDFSVSDANFENIKSNSREAVWEENMDRYYEPHPIRGSGLGVAADWMKHQEGLHLIHSDYVQMLCEIGLIGISLFGIFVLVTLFSIIATTWASNAPLVLKLTGGMALGSCAGTFFSMAYDNVVTYAQQSFVLPFIFIGIYLKVKELYNNGEWQ